VIAMRDNLDRITPHASSSVPDEIPSLSRRGVLELSAATTFLAPPHSPEVHSPNRSETGSKTASEGLRRNRQMTLERGGHAFLVAESTNARSPAGDKDHV
jgi:hypothetical protein